MNNLHFTGKSLLLVFILLLYHLEAFAQPQMNNWFFPSGNGLNFSSGKPVNITGGQVFAMEGCSSISDSTGQLLFYTDGIRVWNKKHALMADGLNGGGTSSTQSCVIVPKTKDGKEYYIFTADQEGGPMGLQYSIVDMTANGGLGGMTVKNSPLITPTCEKVTAVRHCNKKDYWVITHKYNSADYYAYLVTATGVSASPVISTTGSLVYKGFGTMAGQLKASPDGTKLAAANGQIGVDLLDFDNRTGIVSNGVEIFNNANAAHYGVEFSANSSMLYAAISNYWDATAIARISGVFQYDLTQPSVAAVINSKNQLCWYTDNTELGSLQRGPDGMIYMAHYRETYLSVIKNPEVYGVGCNYTDAGVLLPAASQFSLPNLLNDYSSIDSFSLGNTSSCINEPVNFNYKTPGNILSVIWDFGDPISGALNNSTNPPGSHIYTVAGDYSVKLITFGVCGNDTVTGKVTVGDVRLDLGKDQNFCQGSTVTLSAENDPTYTFLWQDGRTRPDYIASAPGLYWVQVGSNANGCIRRDSVTLTEILLPSVNLGADTALCTNDSLLLDARNPGADFQWEDNSQQATKLVKSAGIYWVQATKDGCQSIDSIEIAYIHKPVFTLGDDRPICPDQPILLNPGIRDAAYLWQDGSSGPDYRVSQAGTFFVDISNICGVTRDSIVIFKGICNINIPDAFTPNSDGKNDLFKVISDEDLPGFSLVIYNRWGQLVFSAKDKSLGWDGRFKNNLCMPGAYVYILQYKNSNAQPQIKKGTLLLLR